MNKKVAATLALILCCLTIFGQKVETSKSQIVAKHFYQSAIAPTTSTPQLAYTGTEGSRGAACFYVYNIDNGFVIVSADERVQPILGYSTEGAFTPNDLPFGLQDLLQSYTDEISAIKANIAEADPQLQACWQSLTEGSWMPSRGGRSVSALLDNESGINNWQQNNGYNYYCPTDASGPAGKCYVGCCALSMGQVIHYWQHPTQGTGSHSYECNHSSSLDGLYGDYGTLSANFGATTYNYALMPNNLNSSTPSNQILAIAKLLYHCGVSIEMWYGNQSSMGFHTDIADALETYFKYDECLTLWKDSYNGDWETLLKSDLDLGRPIIYCAYANVGGHEFVCDGYNDNNFFHFNMGWGGSYNGYYAINNLNAQYNFNSSHGAVLNIRPKTETPDGVNENEISMRIFPNPVTDRCQVECENGEMVRVYDAMGKLIVEKTMLDGQISLQTRNFPAGIYMVQVLTKEGHFSIQKIVKK
ncbi:MAG: thiol protease/hemagglutinin PrtT [Bacteroidales bacterium]|nr:thiol protease/hemagglutinin PrtT [Bacteroidales bacterium]